MGRIIAIPVGVLSIVALCAVCATCSILALFLQSMYALNREIVVADVVMYPMQQDNNGTYIEIDFTPYNQPSALGAVFNPALAENPSPVGGGRTERYRLYGDVVAVRGPLVRLHPLLQILGYQNVYKLALIEGEYRMPGAINRLEGSEAVINGGFEAAWWDLNAQEGTYPYNLLVDRITFAGDEEPGHGGPSPVRYQIVVTTDAITWNRVGTP